MRLETASSETEHTGLKSILQRLERQIDLAQKTMISMP